MRRDFEDKMQTLTTGAGKPLAEAIRLSRPGRSLPPDEIKVVIAGADAIEAAGGPTTEDEERVVQSATRLRIYTPTREGPPDPVDWLQRLAMATAALEAVRLLQNKALVDVAPAQQRAGRGSDDPPESARLNAATRAAERGRCGGQRPPGPAGRPPGRPSRA